MHFKKYYKYMITICIVLFILIISILFTSDIIDFKGQNNKKNNMNVEPTVYNIALIVDKYCSETKVNLLTKSLDDISEQYDKTYKIYNAKDYDNSYEKTVDAASLDGVGLIICPDASFEEALYELQNKYVAITFLIIDGVPHNSDNTDTTINFNAIPLIHDDADAGFLAGYAAVYSGHSRINFVGLKDDSSSYHYCYGFLQGADRAAIDMNRSDLHISYSFVDEDKAEDEAIEYCRNEADVIVACNNKIIDPVLKIASEKEVPVIACGDDYSSDDNEYLIASTNKNTYISTYDCLAKFYSNEISAGSIQSYSTTNDAITLDFKSDDLGEFDSNIYNSILLKLANDEIPVIGDTTVPVEDLELEKITPILKTK